MEPVLSDDGTVVSPVASVVSPSSDGTVVEDGSPELIDSLGEEGAVELVPVISGVPDDSRANGVVSVVLCSAVVSAVPRVETEIAGSVLASVTGPESVDVISEDVVTGTSLGEAVDPEMSEAVLTVSSTSGPLVDSVEDPVLGAVVVPSGSDVEWGGLLVLPVLASAFSVELSGRLGVEVASDRSSIGFAVPPVPCGLLPPPNSTDSRLVSRSFPPCALTGSPVVGEKVEETGLLVPTLAGAGVSVCPPVLGSWVGSLCPWKSVKSGWPGWRAVEPDRLVDREEGVVLAEGSEVE